MVPLYFKACQMVKGILNTENFKGSHEASSHCLF